MIEKKFFIIPEALAVKRLDIAISELDENISRSRAEKIIESGKVQIDGDVVISKKSKVKAGSEISIEIEVEEEIEMLPEDIPLDIIYEDEDVIVLNKPRGMVVHPGNGNDTGTLVNALLAYCGDNLSAINGEIRRGIVHRIDKDTSGLIMIAKNDEAHKSLAKQLKEHTVTRKYIGLAVDNIKEDELEIDEPIGRDRNNRMRRQVRGSNMKEAITHIRILERYGRYTLFEARLETGRTHQIRVHMAYIKHPLVGDTLYGSPIKKQPLHLNGQLLHAKVIGFVHPRTGKYMEFDSELPCYFKEALSRLRRVL